VLSPSVAQHSSAPYLLIYYYTVLLLVKFKGMEKARSVQVLLIPIRTRMVRSENKLRYIHDC